MAPISPESFMLGGSKTEQSLCPIFHLHNSKQKKWHDFSKLLTYKWHNSPKLCSILMWKIIFCLLNEPEENIRVLSSTQDLTSDLKSASKELETTSRADTKAECSHTTWAGVHYFVPVSNLYKPLSPPGSSYVIPSLSTDKYLLSLKGLLVKNCPTASHIST